MELEHATGLGIVKMTMPEQQMDKTNATEPLVAKCEQTLEHLDEIDTRLAVLCEEIEKHAKRLDD